MLVVDFCVFQLLLGIVLFMMSLHMFGNLK